MKVKIRLIVLLGVALVLPPASMMLAQQGGAAGAAAGARAKGPCDIYGAGGTPCVTAHSTTRALSASYNGSLYQVIRQSDGKTMDIGLASGTGYADAAAQDTFCANTLCMISEIYDQSGKGNHLLPAPPGTFKGPAKGAFNTMPIADMAPVTLDGHKVYGVFIMPGMGFRNNNATGLAIDDEPEGIYSVMDGTHYSSGCCFDYGNGSPNGRAVGTGTMETTYFGTATAWGTGSGRGPWIEADFEAGVLSGYNAKQNPADPTIDSWRFVTAVVDGGGGNKWDLRGGNAQQGGLTTFYNGKRPGSETSNAYFPMHKPGAVLLGNGGDNGNGSAGTFYEGVMTFGYPTEATVDAVQANIVAAKYNVAPIELSRVTTFTPGSTQEIIATYTNTTGAPVRDVKVSLNLPAGWRAVASSSESSMSFANPVAPGSNVSATFKLTSPAATGAGFTTGKVEWAGAVGGTRSETITQRVRNVLPVKINEVLMSNPSNQFIELYNAGGADIDISNWSLVSTQSGWASVKLATIPAGTKLAKGAFYLFGLSSSGLTASANAGDSVINVRSVTGFEVGQQITVDGESRKVTAVGTAAAPLTTAFIPISTGPWLTFPAGTTRLPVADIAGFAVGQKIGIDIGGIFEVATITEVGKQSTQTILSAAVSKGATSMSVAAAADIVVGDTLTISTGARKEVVIVKSVSMQAAAGGDGAGGRGGRGRGGGAVGIVELTAPLQQDHASGVDVSDVASGVAFTPATKFAHKSGDALQALGSGITLDAPLAKAHEYGAPVVNPQAKAEGFQGPPAPQQWFGATLATTAGSIALMDGAAVVDAMVYGSQQSSSSANGTITSPELATLEGVQTQGGCIAVVPGSARSGRGNPAPAGPSRSAGRPVDGADTDSNCADFKLQTPTPGAGNPK